MPDPGVCVICARPIASGEGYRLSGGEAHAECGELALFEIPDSHPPEPLAKLGATPLWTEHKAQLIERYLYYFVLITKHGTYIDGFAGPQELEHPEMWSAKLVLESQPRWLRHFYLFDADRDQAAWLRSLKAEQPQPDRTRREPKRTIDVYEGDFNAMVQQVLATRPILEKEATFCLLDQRTFECHWSTVDVLARYKRQGHKIELFYFLPNAWLDRALAAQMDTAVLERWWGRRDWSVLRGMPGIARAQLVAKRIKDDFHYASVRPMPIFDRQRGRRVMYFMVHASDHPEAPRLMARAYRRAVLPKEPAEQLALELGATLDPPEDDE